MKKIIPATLVCIASAFGTTANADLVDNSKRTVTLKTNTTATAKLDTCKGMIPMAQAIMVERQRGIPKEHIVSLVNQNTSQSRVEYGTLMTNVAYEQDIQETDEDKMLMVEVFSKEFFNYCMSK